MGSHTPRREGPIPATTMTTRTRLSSRDVRGLSVADARRSTSKKNVQPAAVLTDEHGIVTAWTPEAEALTGHTAEEMVGQPAWEICSRMAPPGHDPDEIRRRVKAMVDGIFTSGHIPSHPPHSHFRFQRSDGEVRTLEHDVATVPAKTGFGLAAFVRDVTDEAAEHKPDMGDEVEAATLHRLLFERMSNAVAIAEATLGQDGKPADYRIIDVNPAFERLTGFAADRFAGKLISEVRPDLREDLIGRANRVASSGEPDEFEGRDEASDRTVLIRLSRVGPTLLMAMIEDVTEARRAEAAVRERNAFIETIVTSAGEGFAVFDRDLRCLVWNPMMEHLSGLAAEQVFGRRPSDLFPAEMASRVEAGLRHAIESGDARPQEHEYTLPRAGQRIWLLGAYRPHKDDAGAVIGAIVSIRDFTDTHNTQDALRQSEQQFRDIFDGVGDGVAIYDPSGAFIEVNRMLCERLGYSREELLSMSIVDIDSPESAALLPDRVAKIMRGGVGLFEVSHIRRDGTRIPTEIVSRKIHFRGRPAILTVQRDVTERHRAEEKLRKQTNFLQNMLNAIPIPIIAKDRDGRILMCNASFAAVGGLRIEDATGKTVDEVGIPDSDMHISHDQALLDGGTLQMYDAFMPTVDRGLRRHLLSKAPLLDEDGSIIGIVTAAVDIHDRYEAEQALKLSEERFRTLFEYAGDAIFISDLDGRFIDVNQTACDRLGYSKDELVGKSVVGISPPEAGQAAVGRLQTLLTRGSLSFETTHLRRDGSAVPVEMIATMIDLGGQPALLGIARDISDRQKAEAERTALEDQLRQAQKMEGIGQLAGGIAHDFNNLLTAIRGSASLALASLPPGEGPREDMEQIEQAADRAAALTRQLLAFARRTVLQPEVVDLGNIVRRVEPMLRRLIGEDVTLVTAVTDEPCCVLADPGQLEQVIVNLAVNARDAMPNGGELGIEIATAEEVDGAGPMTTITVTDTGTGMEAETLSHMFEPFFTTKGPGKGTGLGLATAYGIVRQSGGTITARSELGRGSTFTVFLPRVGACSSDTEKPPKKAAATSKRAGTILVVEDDNGVRRFASRVLEAAGYAVRTASDGVSAIVASSDGPVQLLVTDVVMPGMSGREVAIKLAAVQPGLRVLYMSGHTDKGIVHDGVLEPDIEFLAKPFTSEALLAAVDKAMSGASRD